MVRPAFAAFAFAASMLLAVHPAIAQTKVTKSHALTLGDKPKYGPDFKHLDYVNPNAPKGGDVRLYSIGSFDTFNPFIIKGDPAVGLGRIFETLMTTPEDDSQTEYGLIAESVEVPEDLSYVIYHLRAGAKFHDGTQITADDVVFSFNLLKEKGRPIYRFYYANVTKAEALDPRRVKFSFSGPRNRELPQIVGQVPVLSKKYWSTRDFSKTTLEPPLGSGPYRIKSFEPGRFIVYERVKNYWGKDLPVNRGRENFDVIRYDLYRDQVVALEAFKAHQYDFRLENSSKEWATGYDFPKRRQGLVKTASLPNKNPVGMQAFIFNTRRDKFKDPVLRQALGYAFDFEWSNKNLFYGQYTRTRSYFENSELAATELPSAAELALLEPWRGKIPDEVFTKVYQPPKTDGSGNLRKNLRQAARLLRKAGWKVENNKLIDPKSGKPLEIEFLLVSPAFERIVTPFVRNLKRLGIQSRIRTVDPAQYQNRIREFDFDSIVTTFGQSLSPGNEQRDFWSSKAVSRPGSRNLIGVSDPAIDALVDKIIAAPDRKSLVVATRALDRVLQWNHFVVPQWHIRSDRIAWWDRFGRPPVKPDYGVGFSSWWIDPEKDALLKKREKSGN
jgi:microcin C transport system substrate-binding protein